MTDDKLLALANHLAVELLRRAYDEDPSHELFVAEAIVAGTGSVAAMIVPHAPTEVHLLFVDDQGAQCTLLELRGAEPDAG